MKDDWPYEALYPEVKRGWRFWLVALSGIPIGLGLFFSGYFAFGTAGSGGRLAGRIVFAAIGVLVLVLVHRSWRNKSN